MPLALQDQAYPRSDESPEERSRTLTLVTTALDAAKAAGLTVVRTWFFQDAPSAQSLLQPQPGIPAPPRAAPSCFIML